MEKKKKKLFPLALGEEAESREQRGLMILASASGMLHLHSQLLLFSLTCSLFLLSLLVPRWLCVQALTPPCLSQCRYSSCAG